MRFCRNEPAVNLEPEIFPLDKNTQGSAGDILAGYAICQSYLRESKNERLSSSTAVRRSRFIARHSDSTDSTDTSSESQPTNNVDSSPRDPLTFTSSFDQPTTRPRPHRCAIYRSAVASAAMTTRCDFASGRVSSQSISRVHPLV